MAGARLSSLPFYCSETVGACGHRWPPKPSQITLGEKPGWVAVKRVWEPGGKKEDFFFKDFLLRRLSA